MKELLCTKQELEVLIADRKPEKISSVGNYGYLFREGDKLVPTSSYGNGCYLSLGYFSAERRGGIVALCIHLYDQEDVVNISPKVVWERYLRYLINSPLGHAFYSRDARKVLKDRVICIRPDVSGIYMMTAMTAVRYTNEYSHLPFTWDTFVRWGMQPDIAFYVAHAYGLRPKEQTFNGLIKNGAKLDPVVAFQNKGSMLHSSHGVLGAPSVGGLKRFLTDKDFGNPFEKGEDWLTLGKYHGIHDLMGFGGGVNFQSKISEIAIKTLPLSITESFNGNVKNPVFCKKHSADFIKAVNAFYTELTGIEYVK